MAINEFMRKMEKEKEDEIGKALGLAQTGLSIYNSGAGMMKSPDHSTWQQDLQNANDQRNMMLEKTPGHQMSNDYNNYLKTAMGRKMMKMGQV